MAPAINRKNPDIRPIRPYPKTISCFQANDTDPHKMMALIN